MSLIKTLMEEEPSDRTLPWSVQPRENTTSELAIDDPSRPSRTHDRSSRFTYNVFFGRLLLLLFFVFGVAGIYFYAL